MAKDDQKAEPNQQQVTTAPKKFGEHHIQNILSKVNNFVDAGELVLPPNYIAENAVRSAWLVLLETVDRNNQPALEVCSIESVANAFLEMVTKGLSVVKNQCYFVVYGNKLSLEDSYIGKILLAKRDADVKDVNSVSIYEGDEFEYEILPNARKKVNVHKSKLENMQPDKLVGAYAVVEYNDGSTDTEIMTMAQIRLAWQQGGAKGNSPAHKNFPDQMAEKTVINRALKIDVGSSDDRVTQVNQLVDEAKIKINTQTATKALNFENAQIVEDPAPAVTEPEPPIEKPEEKEKPASALTASKLFDDDDKPGFA